MKQIVLDFKEMCNDCEHFLYKHVPPSTNSGKVGYFEQSISHRITCQNKQICDKIEQKIGKND